MLEWIVTAKDKSGDKKERKITVHGDEAMKTPGDVREWFETYHKTLDFVSAEPKQE